MKKQNKVRNKVIKLQEQAEHKDWGDKGVKRKKKIAFWEPGILTGFREMHLISWQH